MIILSTISNIIENGCAFLEIWVYFYFSREVSFFFPTQVWDEMKTKTKDMILYSTHQSHFLRILVFGQSVVLSKSSFKSWVFRWKNPGNCIYQLQTAHLRMRISAPHFRVWKNTRQYPWETCCDDPTASFKDSKPLYFVIILNYFSMN